MAKAICKIRESELGKYFRNPQSDKCDACGIEYDDFRTGEDYQSVYDTLWKASDDRSQWLNKGRHTVLGRWHELKQSLWRDHLEMCDGTYVQAEDLDPWEQDIEY